MQARGRAFAKDPHARCTYRYMCTLIDVSHLSWIGCYRS